MAAHLASINIHVDLIVHSTKARAKQTAVILARQLNPIKGISEGEDLGPNADPMIWTKRLAGLNENVMMVGHMPYMSRMASLLACGFSDESAFIFGNSAVICLERFYEAWSINWMITPQVICDDTQA
jgi:phosphohistidine phosphatase